MGGIARVGRIDGRISIIAIRPGGKDEAGNFQVKANMRFAPTDQKIASTDVEVSIPYDANMTLEKLELSLVEASNEALNPPRS